ncbi:hypothetical protein C2E20_4035 [Micractinium conductrix]|uniref:Uncharacterized protein n=1 Tax=Micractinium conductrix TaxID=554055 RepID=A0A2P6VFL8_9CHLO|nr:hypothetical protein C2E20_4035 [Micractinium conductrix]|eukprot:PSC72882.1 hypothetical protein C2E20_4035 [Micractinium conductrix]
MQAALRAGQQLQQRAERRRGQEAADLHSQASAKYREALAAAGRDDPECLFGLAESLQEGAEATLAAAAQAPDGAQTAAAGAAAGARAVALLADSVAAYRRVVEDGEPRVDALVCAGNALSTWAEVCAWRDAAQAVQLLQQATESYQAALQREEDALTWSNLADALIQQAELCCEAGQGQAGGALFQEAMQAYHRACSLSDAADGDDVPGLLVNWGRGLLAMAQQAQELALAVSLLDEAARRLEQSAAFQRGSTDPLLALGDVLLERGEKLAAAGDGAGAAAALQRALSDGYHAARRISSSSPEAAVGEADVHVQLARLAMAAGNGEAAAEQWALAEAAYALALRQPTAFDWSERVTFATGSSSVGFSPDSQLLKGSGLFLLGAYGVRDAAASAATAAGTPFSFGSARWQPPGPVGGAASSVGVFENRLLGFDAHVPPAHKLPDLSKHVRGGKLRFKVTAPAKSTC